MCRTHVRIISSIICILFICLLCSCAHQTPNNVASHGIVKDWNGFIDEIEILEPLNLSDYSRLIVAKLDTSATTLPPADENTYEPTKIVLKSSADIFTNALRDQFKEAKSSLEIVGPEDKVTGADIRTLLVKGKVTEMNPGSQALRYWVGFGAGKSRVEVAGEIIDAKSNKPMVKFKHAKASGIGVFGGDYQKFLTDNTHDVGEDIGKMLLYFVTSSK